MAGGELLIPVKEIIEQVRLEEKDIRQEKFSDYQILKALQKAMRQLANTCATMNTEFFESMQSFSLEQVLNGVDLPIDYISMKSVRDLSGRALSPGTGRLDNKEYQIVSGRLYALEPVIITYSCSLPAPQEGEVINLPEPLRDMIVSLTRMIVENSERDVLTQFINSEVRNIIPRRKWSNIKTKMPFKV